MNLAETTQAALATLFPPAAEQPAQAPDGEQPAPPPPRQPGVLATDFARTGYHLDVLCPPGQVVAVARLLDEAGFFLESIAGVDWLERSEMEVLYDFNRLGGEHCRVLVRTPLDRANPEVPTLAGIIPAADWHERETYDFYGIRFLGHPNLIRILLPEDADFYPLRKDYQP